MDPIAVLSQPILLAYTAKRAEIYGPAETDFFARFSIPQLFGLLSIASGHHTRLAAQLSPAALAVAQDLEPVADAELIAGFENFAAFLARKQALASIMANAVDAHAAGTLDDGAVIGAIEAV